MEPLAPVNSVYIGVSCQCTHGTHLESCTDQFGPTVYFLNNGCHLFNDPENNGSCNFIPCPSGQTCQSGTCVSTACSPSNPTGTCPSGQSCSNGGCCASGQTFCNDPSAGTHFGTCQPTNVCGQFFSVSQNKPVTVCCPTSTCNTQLPYCRNPTEILQPLSRHIAVSIMMERQLDCVDNV
jgi:hypothetical protein